MSDIPTQRALGRLEGQLATLTAMVQAQGEASDAGRSRLHKRMDEFAEEISAVKARMSKTDTALARIEPLVDDFAKLKQRGLGAMAVLALAWVLLSGAVVSAISTVWGMIAKALTHG